jgi:shikimate kinase
MRIFLIGYMGAGKTTVGKKLARKLNMDFVDLDDCFEQKYKLTIPIFFNRYGEMNFRKLEREVLLDSLNLENTVISTGGGMPCYFDNMHIIQENGYSVYVQMTPSALANRLIHSKRNRPLIRDLEYPELFDHIKKHLDRREVYYKQADLVINGVSLQVDELALKIKEALLSSQ